MSSCNNFSINETEAALKGMSHIQMLGHSSIFDSSSSWLRPHYNAGIEICFIIKGRFEWTIEAENYVLYPGDCTFTLPWQRHGGSNDVMDVGELAWIIIQPEIFSPQEGLALGAWSNIPIEQQRWLGETLRNSPAPYSCITFSIFLLFLIAGRFFFCSFFSCFFDSPFYHKP
jgi:mannose-6-phosphate isomerase-like protein (cupin superfamily)